MKKTTTNETTSTTKTATTKTSAAKKPATPVTGVTPEIPVAEIDWEYQRRHQSRPLTSDEIAQLAADLLTAAADLATYEVTVGDKKNFYRLRIVYQGKTLITYWAKRDFPRLVITERVRKLFQTVVPLSERTAYRAEERGSSTLLECPDEFVVTPAEAVAVLRDLLTAVTKPKTSKPKTTTA